MVQKAPHPSVFGKSPFTLCNVTFSLVYYRNESFTFAASPATQLKIFVWIFDHKTLGKDKELGAGEIDVSIFY